MIKKVESINLCSGSSPGSEIAIRGTRYVYDHQGPGILLTAGIHGDEATAPAALWYLQEQLEREPLSGVVTVLPCVNVLAVRASSRLTPQEKSDLNRCFPGRKDGSLAERLAACLVEVLDNHDALIDVHTAGWSVPFILLDPTSDSDLRARVISWARAASLPLVDEMLTKHFELQGLGSSWSAWAMSKKKSAFTMELSGFHTLESATAKAGAESLLAVLRAGSLLAEAAPAPDKLPFRHEIYSGTGGLFEAFCRPGDYLYYGQTIGVVRSLDGTIQETILSSGDGLLLALQPISAVHVGSYLATIAIQE